MEEGGGGGEHEYLSQEILNAVVKQGTKPEEIVQEMYRVFGMRPNKST